jgi:hypothetical protein
MSEHRPDRRSMVHPGRRRLAIRLMLSMSAWEKEGANAEMSLTGTASFRQRERLP